MYTWSTANALSILAKILYIGDNAFSIELRNYVDTVLKTSVYRYDPPEHGPESGTKRTQRLLLNMILKILLLLIMIFIHPLAALTAGLLILIDLITLFFKGET